MSRRHDNNLQITDAIGYNNVVHVDLYNNINYLNILIRTTIIIILYMHIYVMINV